MSGLKRTRVATKHEGDKVYCYLCEKFVVPDSKEQSKNYANYYYMACHGPSANPHRFPQFLCSEKEWIQKHPEVPQTEEGIYVKQEIPSETATTTTTTQEKNVLLDLITECRILLEEMEKIAKSKTNQ